MTRVHTNASEVAADYQRRAAALSAALERGIQAAMAKVEEVAQANLGGSPLAAPYSYPVPVRTDNLRAQLGAEQVSPVAAVVFDTADYAWAVHEGVVTQWAGRGKTRKVRKPARPFLTDALETADPAAIVAGEIEKAVFA